MPDEPTKKSNKGIISSLVSSISSTIKSDGVEDPNYEGHPGATGYFVRPTATYGVDSPSDNTTNSYNSNSSGNATSTGMSGYGNPNFKDARDDKSLLQRASQISAVGLASISSSFAYGKGASSTTSSPPEFTSRASNDEYQYATNRGPTAISQSNPYSGQQTWHQGLTESTITASGSNVVPLFASGADGTSKVGAGASDGEYERKWVQGLCEPAGLKAVPPEEKLQSFLNIAPTLSPDIVGPCLIEVFNSEAWQSRTKGLAVLYSMLSSEECAGHRQWWLDHKEDLSCMLHDSKASVRSQALKTLQLIDRDAVLPEGSGVSAKESFSSSSSEKRSHHHYASSASAATSVPTAAVPAVEVSLLESYDLLSNDSTPSIAAFSSPVAENGGLFAGLTMGPSSTEATPTAATAVNASSNSISSSFDFVQEQTPSTVAAPNGSAPPQSKAAVDAFDQFESLLDAPLPPLASPQPEPAASQGFDFISTASSSASSGLSDLSILDLSLPLSAPPPPLPSAGPSVGSVMISGKALGSDLLSVGGASGPGGASGKNQENASFNELLQLSGMSPSQQKSSVPYNSPPVAYQHQPVPPQQRYPASFQQPPVPPQQQQQHQQQQYYQQQQYLQQQPLNQQFHHPQNTFQNHPSLIQTQPYPQVSPYSNDNTHIKRLSVLFNDNRIPYVLGFLRLLRQFSQEC